MSDESYYPRSRRLVRHRVGSAGVPVRVGRSVVSHHGGIGRRTPPATLNATEVRVSMVLDAEFVPAQEIAGFAGVSTHECRRALATLREKGIAECVRRGRINVWRAAA